MLKRIGSVGVLTLCLTACSMSDFLGWVMPSSSGGIDTEVVVGDKNQAIHAEVGSETHNQKADSIINNITDEVPIWLILVAIAGWVLPTPQGMWKAWRSRNDKG